MYRPLFLHGVFLGFWIEMPYKDREKDRKWHRDYMKKCCSGLKMGVTIEKRGVVTPEVIDVTPFISPKLMTNSVLEYDADGDLIPGY